MGLTPLRIRGEALFYRGFTSAAPLFALYPQVTERIENQTDWICSTQASPVVSGKQQSNSLPIGIGHHE